MPFPPDELRTERLLLRRPRLSDADAIFGAYARDPAVTRYMTWQPHRHVGDTRAFLQACVDSWARGFEERPWVIERDGALLGMIGVTLGPHGVNLGYLLAREHWGRGYMTEAVTAVCDAAIGWPGVHRVWAYCDVDNRASARVLEKAGMQLEGTLRRFVVHPNVSDAPRDCLCYARVR